MMFNEMRRKDKQITINQAEQILNDGEYGVLSLQGTYGYPYAVPLNYVYKNKNIYFHCAKDGFKLDCIAYDNSVSFCVVSKSEIISSKFTTDFSSVIIFGKAEEAFAEEKNQALKALIDKYSKDYIKEGCAYIEKSIDTVKVIKINVEHITGKSKNHN
jgi:nitroimidazol reductase NimA-like FMN-containing flavoprotein (pyridoxamine 5'-phosphate oxidase superfamily)